MIFCGSGTGGPSVAPSSARSSSGAVSASPRAARSTSASPPTPACSSRPRTESPAAGSSPSRAATAARGTSARSSSTAPTNRPPLRTETSRIALPLRAAREDKLERGADPGGVVLRRDLHRDGQRRAREMARERVDGAVGVALDARREDRLVLGGGGAPRAAVAQQDAAVALGVVREQRRGRRDAGAGVTAQPLVEGAVR